jgi:DNA-binding IclR family transcriptional regulator
MSENELQGTQVLVRAMRLLGYFNDNQPEWALKDLSEATGINRTTAYRLLRTLESAHYVAQDPHTGMFRLGSELIILGARAQRANPLHLVSQQILLFLAHKTGEMASIEILEGDKTLIINEVKGEQQRRVGTSVGNMWYAHTTSTGKMLLAHLAYEDRRRVMPAILPCLTESTICDWERLDAELEHSYAQGYAMAQDELETGFCELAAPVFDYRHSAIAALSIGGSSARLTPERLPELIGLVKRAAYDVSLRLGYRG